MQKHENDKSLCPFCGTFLHRNASIMFTPIPWFRCSRFVSSRLFRDWNFLKGLIDWLVFDRNKRSGLTVSEWSSTSGKTWTYNPNISASDRIIGVYISYGWHGFDSVCFFLYNNYLLHRLCFHMVNIAIASREIIRGYHQYSWVLCQNLKLASLCGPRVKTKPTITLGNAKPW